MTHQEQSELDDWYYSSERNRNLFNKLTNEGFLAKRLQELQEINEDKEWCNIVRMADSESLKPERRWIMYSVAAAVTVFVISAIVFFSMRDRKSENFAGNLRLAHLQLSGFHEKDAVLVLSDGQQVILDKNNRQSIPLQGNTQVRIENDLLYYTTGKNTGTVAGFNKVINPSGKQYQLVLSDSTVVWLNAGSCISYPVQFDKNERVVAISGEAYFEVAHRSEQPFLVQVYATPGEQGAEVKVLGTKFNINAYPENHAIITSLLEGSVAFTPVEKDHKAAPVILKPGEEVQLSPDRQPVKSRKDIAKIVSWKDGIFDFKKESLETILNWITRWYGIEVVNKSSFDGTLSVTFTKDMTLERVLDIIRLTSNGSIRIIRSGDAIHIGAK